MRKLPLSRQLECFLFFPRYCFSVSSNPEQCSPRLYVRHCFLQFWQKLIQNHFIRVCTFLEDPILQVDIEMSSEYEAQDLL